MTELYNVPMFTLRCPTCGEPILITEVGSGQKYSNGGRDLYIQWFIGGIPTNSFDIPATQVPISIKNDIFCVLKIRCHRHGDMNTMLLIDGGDMNWVHSRDLMGLV